LSLSQPIRTVIRFMRNSLMPFMLLLSAAATASAAAQSVSPEGNWLTEKKSGIVEIYRCTGDDTLCGRLVWFQIKPDDPNPQGLDLKNPDPARRNQLLCGLTFMSRFKLAESNSWEDGTVYDPDSGNTYHATMKLQADGMLRLRGYIGISLIGASEVWTRYTDRVPQCPTR
jgi:uncharacterized protein (DUF2147 family)